MHQVGVNDTDTGNFDPAQAVVAAVAGQRPGGC
jgi:hypothetical protein